MNDFNGELNKSLDDFMESYKMVDTEEIYSNGTEFVPIFRVKQWFEYNNQDKEIERLENIIKEVREYIKNNSLYEQDYTYDYEENIEEWPPDDTKARKELLEILDKVDKENTNEKMEI